MRLDHLLSKEKVRVVVYFLIIKSECADLSLKQKDKGCIRG
ncbi:hypothetical protein M2454_003124 [Aequitasia blattaphilus]